MYDPLYAASVVLTALSPERDQEVYRRMARHLREELAAGRLGREQRGQAARLVEALTRAAGPPDPR
jgi:hypothetical protein